MQIFTVRQNFHQLIDTIKDEGVLTQFYEALNESASKNLVWDKLTKQEQEQVLQSYAESEQNENIVSEPSIAEKYKRWLSK